MTIAISGATGQLGRLLVEQLKARTNSADLIALARTPAKAQALGIAVREADYNRASTLNAALQGVDTLMLISSSEVGQREAQHRQVIDAARANGVRRLVYTSLLHADTSVLSLAGEHLATEQMLKASGLAWTLLRNGWYSENHTNAIAGALANGALVGSAGEGRIAAAPRADYAEAAAIVLTSQGHEGKTLELAGDSAFTLAELAAEVSRQTGKTLAYQNLPVADYARVLTGVGLPDGLAAAIAGWDQGASVGALYDDSHTLSKLLGRPTTPLAQVVATALAQLPA
jgi:NAD(P)H dehydrogenase (quinone)